MQPHFPATFIVWHLEDNENVSDLAKVDSEWDTTKGKNSIGTTRQSIDHTDHRSPD